MTQQARNLVRLDDIQQLVDMTMTTAPQRIQDKVRELLRDDATMNDASADRLFVITIPDDDFHKLTDRSQHLRETLRTEFGDIRLIIQREGE